MLNFKIQKLSQIFDYDHVEICVKWPSESSRRGCFVTVSLNNSNQLANVDISMHPTLKKLQIRLPDNPNVFVQSIIKY